MKIFQKVYKIVSHIPRGKVMTYKQVSELAKTTPRIVGFALHSNKDSKNIPCHRVVKSDGTLAKGYAFGGKEKQKEKLKQEGAAFIKTDTIDLFKSLFNPLQPENPAPG